MVNEKINVLILGTGAVTDALSRKLKENSRVGEIFAAGENIVKTDYYTYIDIRENDLTGLLMFALENDIGLTIPVSEKALRSDVVSFFQSNGQNIFGSSKESCEPFLNKLVTKKILYKIHAQPPKFAIYNKIGQFKEYLSKSNFPVQIRTPENNGLQNDKFICTTLKSAQNFLEKLFLKGESDILIEDYTYGHSFTVYFITDGYCAVPLNIAGNYKFLGADNSGMYLDGVGAYAPDYKISNVVIEKVSNIAQDILNELEAKGTPYMGIMGIECVMTGEDKFIVEDLKPFLQNYDSCAILTLVEDDLIEIFTSCINGFFADECEYIRTKDYSCASLCVYSTVENSEIKGIENLENIDFIRVKKNGEKYYSNIGLNFTLTRCARTLNRAKKLLYEDLSEINFNGIKYRKDICVNIKK